MQTANIPSWQIRVKLLMFLPQGIGLLLWPFFDNIWTVSLGVLETRLYLSGLHFFDGLFEEQECIFNLFPF